MGLEKGQCDVFPKMRGLGQGATGGVTLPELELWAFSHKLWA